MKRVWFGVALALGLAGSAWAAGDRARGQMLTSYCSGCHEVPGYRNAYPGYHVPKLGGQHPEYIVSALKAYKTKQRKHPTMNAIAADLSDQEMQDLAAFFGGTSTAAASQAPASGNVSGGGQGK